MTVRIKNMRNTWEIEFKELEPSQMWKGRDGGGVCHRVSAK